MFGLGTAELLIILFIALVVLGPKELPKVARTLGRGIRELQRAKDDIKKNIEFEDDTDEKTKFQAPEKDENT
ncbi:MAG: twin-arginine translocase TatA/TatE family subunit [Candidatus Dadabacteria bacterium]|nr:twin-arginine translocase TatA/TatE family subunit [Candidatus Dadabacteria bacterium]MYA48027.1 twin-arginine translocase TatA/TatE family subunit [Candidatus Dadabacteria bacterium]MYF47587.1 twin-arginine translocase TatA/TatE family subunit [Candidatus Dadabacteria bacterium]MYG82698.1 twin-arginine translocase TatA/TatE family subunit [Candidatus Dadabacteria bacterium]MYK49094.1 twin-arginine translocase TatA/TatE family subunit [Candidatus Dadabacteria bacterium]